MVKRFLKTLPVKTYWPTGDLSGHLFAYGRIGSGKSVSMKTFIEAFHDDKGYKVFDLYGGDRHEGLYWTLPSQETSYWEKLSSLGTLSEEGPKQYKVNLLYPFFESKIPKKLPKKPGFVNSKIFTIPLHDIVAEDAKMVIGLTAESNVFVWNEILEKIKPTDNSGSLEYYANQLKATNTTIYKNFMLPLIREKFLGAKNANTNLDLVEEAKDVETISVLCLEFVPERFHLFIIN